MRAGNDSYFLTPYSGAAAATDEETHVRGALADHDRVGVGKGSAVDDDREIAGGETG